MYKVVVADVRSPRDGRFIEALGEYAPLSNPPGVRLNEDRIMYWLQVGAQPSDTVRSLLSHEGLMLRLHLQRKGKSETDIQEQVAQWKADRESKQTGKASKKQVRAERKKAEDANAAEVKAAADAKAAPDANVAA